MERAIRDVREGFFAARSVTSLENLNTQVWRNWRHLLIPTLIPVMTPDAAGQYETL